jgi:hypothetical protein
MIFYALFISFFIGVVLPGVFLPVFPEMLHNKDLEEGIGNTSLIYLAILFVFFSVMLYVNHDKEVRFFERSKNIVSENKITSILFILILFLSRILYGLYIADSPYKMLIQNQEMLVYGTFNRIVNYFYIVANFKLYALFQGLIVLSLPKRYLPLFFIGEIMYASFIYSKMIIFINIIAIIILFIDYKGLWHKKKLLVYIFFYGLFLTALLFLLREIFGQLRQGGGFSMNGVEFYTVIVEGLSRIQSLVSVFYAEKVLDDWLYGKTLCHVIGYIVPDSLISLPLNCQNIDEPIIIYYYGLSSLPFIEKDMLSFWGEPFANFGLLGVLLFALLVLMVKLFMRTLGEGQYALVLSWVVFISFLVSHTSWSAIVGNIYLSFMLLWIMQYLMNKFNKNKRVSE